MFRLFSCIYLSLFISSLSQTFLKQILVVSVVDDWHYFFSLQCFPFYFLFSVFLFLHVPLTHALVLSFFPTIIPLLLCIYLCFLFSISFSPHSPTSFSIYIFHSLYVLSSLIIPPFLNSLFLLIPSPRSTIRSHDPSSRLVSGTLSHVGVNHLFSFFIFLHFYLLFFCVSLYPRSIPVSCSWLIYVVYFSIISHFFPLSQFLYLPFCSQRCHTILEVELNLLFCSYLFSFLYVLPSFSSSRSYLPLFFPFPFQSPLSSPYMLND